MIDRDEDFKNLLFVINPELYQAVFIEDELEEDEEVFIPRTIGDVEAAMAQLRTLGIQVNEQEYEAKEEKSPVDELRDLGLIED